MAVPEAFNEDELNLFKELCHHWEMLAMGEQEKRAKHQRAEDSPNGSVGVYFETRHAKTGKRTYATLSKSTIEALDTYLARLGFVIPADQPIIRNRPPPIIKSIKSGSVTTKDKLAAFFKVLPKKALR